MLRNAIDGVKGIDFAKLFGGASELNPTTTAASGASKPDKKHSTPVNPENLFRSAKVLDLLVAFSRHLHLNPNNRIDQSIEG